MTDPTEAEALVAYQAVEFLDIPPMDSALEDPPSTKARGPHVVDLGDARAPVGVREAGWA